MSLFSRQHRPQTDDELVRMRLEMVKEQIERRGVRDVRVLKAMRTVPRQLFVPSDYREQAYRDGPLSIGHEQTISQPYVVASMTEELELDDNCRVLEIGTGCGYQTAVLAEIASEVFSLEMIPELYHGAVRTLADLNYTNIRLQIGDGSLGWSEEAPFDRIIVTAAARIIPAPLLNQLAPDGIMIIPLGGQYAFQDLVKLRRTADGLEQTRLYPVRFVPLV